MNAAKGRSWQKTNDICQQTFLIFPVICGLDKIWFLHERTIFVSSYFFDTNRIFFSVTVESTQLSDHKCILRSLYAFMNGWLNWSKNLLEALWPKTWLWSLSWLITVVQVHVNCTCILMQLIYCVAQSSTSLITLSTSCEKRCRGNPWN